MDALAGPFFASAVLLIAAGATKLRDPVPLLRALRSVGLRAPRLLVRLTAAGELLLGVAALLGWPWAAAGVAVSYAAFSAFVLVSLRRGGVLSSCGCFGKDDTPPTGTHVAVTTAAAIVSGLVALQPVDALGSGADASALVVTTAAVAALAYLVLARLPMLTAARRVAR